MDTTAGPIIALPHRVTGRSRSRGVRWLGGALAALLLAGCQADEFSYGSAPKHLREISSQTRQQISELKMSTTSPVLMRIFKEENAFEVWKMDRTGRYALLKEYEICSWSGGLGPKIKEGDRQAPEGYYTITPGLMNPNSSYYLAFNTGYPNAFDRSHGRTGTHLMVHGACSSRGCYAMSDEQIQEIYALARDAFRGGQKGFQLAAYPFRMTPENMARHVGDPNMPFWRMLKEGYDHFELTRHEPKVDVCGRKYVFNATPDGPMSPAAECPGLTQPEQLRIAAAKKAAEDDAKIQVIAARIADEKKAAEEKAIMIAAREGDAIRRAEERRIALAERKEVLASLLGLGSAPAPAAPAAEPEVLPAYSADGVPLPKPAPRDSGRMMALAPSQPASEESRSMFSRLFSFGDERLPVPVAPVAAEETLASAEASSSEMFASTSTASPLLSSDAGADGPAACMDDGNGDCAAVTVMAAPAPPAQERSIIDRIGNWF